MASTTLQIITPAAPRSLARFAPYIERGADYIVAAVSADPATDQNRVTLTFGFACFDTATGAPVPLSGLEALVISNDPEFHPSDSVVLTDAVSLAASASYLRVIQLDPDFFLGVDDELAVTYSTQTGAADELKGLFQVVNWPLSGRGAEAARVYIKALVKPQGRDATVYPPGVAVTESFPASTALPYAEARITWQAERTPRPSSPRARSAFKQGVTGKRTPFVFRASEDAASGVAHYLADLVEVRDKRLFSTRSMDVRRTLAPAQAAFALTTSQYTWTGDSDIVVRGDSTPLGTDRTLVISEDGAAWLSMERLAVRTHFIANGAVGASVNVSLNPALGAWAPTTLALLPGEGVQVSSVTFDALSFSAGAYAAPEGTYSDTSNATPTFAPLLTRPYTINNSWPTQANWPCHPDAPVRPLSVALKVRPDDAAQSAAFAAEKWVRDAARIDRGRSISPTELGRNGGKVWAVFNDFDQSNNDGTVDFTLRRFVDTAYPDVFVQAAYELPSQGDQDEETPTTVFTLQVRAIAGTTPGDDDVVAEVVFGGTQSVPEARLYRLVSGVKVNDATVTTSLEASATPLLLGGGVLELYTAPSRHDEEVMMVAAYFTPHGQPQLGQLLGEMTVPVWTGTSGPWEVGSGFFASSNVGNSTPVASVRCRELALASGRVILGGCIGEARGAEGLAAEAVASATPLLVTPTNWQDATRQGNWWRLAGEDLSLVTYGASSIVLKAPQPVPYDFSDPRPAVELQGLVPASAGKGVAADLSFAQATGELYVGFTALLPESSPVATRFEGASEYASVAPSTPPTLAVVFSAQGREAWLVAVSREGRVWREPLFAYDASTDAASEQRFWVQLAPSGVEEGTTLMVRRGRDLARIAEIAVGPEVFPTLSASGMYAFVGARADAPDLGFNATAAPGQANVALNRFDVYAVLPSEARVVSESGPSVELSRSFVKGGGAVSTQQYLGAQLSAAQTRLAGWPFASRMALPANWNVDTFAVDVATTANISNLASPGAEIDGVTLAQGMKVLVKDQTTASQNGVYTVAGGGALTGQAALSASAPYRVFQGTVNGGAWLRYDAAAASLYSAFTYYAQRVELAQASAQFLSFYPVRLVEIKVRSVRAPLAPGSLSSAPQVRLYLDDSGDLSTATPYTDWLNAASGSAEGLAQLPLGAEAVAQFIIPMPPDSIPVADGLVWLAVKLPPGLELAAVTGPSSGVAREQYAFSDGSTALEGAVEGVQGTGWLIVSSLWHRVWSEAYLLGDNASEGALLQARVRSVSHAAATLSSASASAVTLQSQPSDFSEAVRVDITPPRIEGAVAVAASPFTPAEAQVSLSASDAGASGLWAVRVVREAEQGVGVAGPFQSWAQFAKLASSQEAPASGAVDLRFSLLGTWPTQPKGALLNSSVYQEVYPEYVAQNAGAAAARTIWVDVMDGAGNVTRSTPASVLALPQMLVDTAGPLGRISLADDEARFFRNTPDASAALALAAFDDSSEVQAFRVRTSVGAEPTEGWGAWRSATDYAVAGADANAEDGLRRFEVQFRDAGGTATREGGAWDRLTRFDEGAGGAGLLLLRACTWRPLGATQEYVFLAGMRTTRYDRVVLQLAAGTEGLGGRAFNGMSYAEGYYGESLRFDAGIDRLTVSVNGVEKEKGTDWNIDSATGRVVFTVGSTPPAGADVSCELVRQGAEVHRWDGQRLERVVDLTPLGERIILSIAATSSHLLIGGGSGRLWAYDGVVPSPVPTRIFQVAGTAYPLAAMCVVRFAGNSGEPYVFVGLSGVPRIWSCRAAEAHLPSATWTALEAGDDAPTLAATTGRILSMAFGFDTLFIGTSAGSVIRHRQRKDGSAETVEEVLIAPAADQEVRVSALLCTQDQVLAGIDGRPEIWQATLATPVSAASRSLLRGVTHFFDRRFAYDPAPWQLYGLTGATAFAHGAYRTVGSALQLVTSGGVYSQAAAGAATGRREYITLSGVAGESPTLVLGEDSDWGRLIVGKKRWTMECPILLGTPMAAGAQAGLEISDGRYFLRLGISAQGVMAQSDPEEGSLTALFDPQEAGRGSLTRLWNFSSDAAANRNPHLDENYLPATAAYNAQGWQAARFCALDTTSAVKEMLRLSLAGYWTGSPRVGVSLADGQGFQADESTEVQVRFRLRDSSAGLLTQRLRGRPIRVRCSWAQDGRLITSDATNWAETNVPLPLGNAAQAAPASSAEPAWQMVTLKPHWSGDVRSLAVEFAGIPEGQDVRDPSGGTALAVEIDCVRVVRSRGPVSPADNWVNLKVAVDDRRLTIWTDGSDLPLLDVEGFLTLATVSRRIRLGKTEESSPASTWCFSRIGFQTYGDDEAPGPSLAAPRPLAFDAFRPAWRLATSGGVRCFAHHRGTVWALADAPRLPAQRMASPADRMAQAFALDGAAQKWRREQSEWGRLDEGTRGPIRPFDAATLGGTLVVPAQHGDIVFVAPSAPP